VIDRLSLASKPAELPRERRLTLAALTFVTFFTTCGGAFGVESLIGAVGPALSVLLLFLMPLLWSLPIALMAAELATLMPEEGGYYIWVRRALGPFWAVQVGWWSLSYSVLLLAIYPVLFVSYLSYLIPWMGATHGAGAGALIRWLVAVLMIASAMVVNLRGARDVGRFAEMGACFVLGAFLLLVVFWLVHAGGPATAAAVVMQDLGASHKGVLLLGLSILVLNYSGWDSVSTFANEVERPQRNYPLALGGALVMAVLVYALPVLAGLSSTSDPAVWSADAGWPVIAGMIGGPRLGALLAVAGLVSMWGLFNAQLLYVSRIPSVMARDGWLPKALSKESASAAPSVAIVSLCTITALLSAFSFGNLVVMMCLLYMATLTLEFFTLVALRVRLPVGRRTFRVPGGRCGLVYVCLAPLVVATAALSATWSDGDSDRSQLSIVGIVVCAGITLYFVRRKWALRRHASLVTADAAKNT
jgi:amino acid transporter